MMAALFTFCLGVAVGFGCGLLYPRRAQISDHQAQIRTLTAERDRLREALRTLVRSYSGYRINRGDDEPSAPLEDAAALLSSGGGTDV